VLYAFNKGEVCTCPSRALIQESIYDKFMERLLGPHRQDHPGQPARHQHHDWRTGIDQQLEKIESYVEIGKQEGAQVSLGATLRRWMRRWRTGTTSSQRWMKGHNKMRVFQEEIFGPVLAVTTFTDEAQALEIANDSLYGLGRGRMDP